MREEGLRACPAVELTARARSGPGTLEQSGASRFSVRITSWTTVPLTGKGEELIVGGRNSEFPGGRSWGPRESGVESKAGRRCTSQGTRVSARLERWGGSRQIDRTHRRGHAGGIKTCGARV